MNATEDLIVRALRHAATHPPAEISDEEVGTLDDIATEIENGEVRFTVVWRP